MTQPGRQIGVIDPVTLTTAAVSLVKVFSALFGNKWQYTIGVRWLTAYYQYYVLADPGATSSNRINEQYTTEAQSWFSLVLGVPIYDRYRLHALMGTDAGSGQPLGRSQAQRVSDYLAIGPDTSGEPEELVYRAVQIADQFRWGTAPGSWAKYGIAAGPLAGEDPAIVDSASGGSAVETTLKKNKGLLLVGLAALVLLVDGDS